MEKKETAKKVKVTSKRKTTKRVKINKRDTEYLTLAKDIILKKKRGLVLISGANDFKEEKGKKGVEMDAMFVVNKLPNGAINGLFNKVEATHNIGRKSSIKGSLDSIKAMSDGLNKIDEAERLESRLFKVMSMLVISTVILFVSMVTNMHFVVAFLANVIMIGSFVYSILLLLRLTQIGGYIEGLHKGLKINN